MFRRFSVQDEDAQEVEILLNLNHIVSISHEGIFLTNGDSYQSFIELPHVFNALDGMKI